MKPIQFILALSLFLFAGCNKSKDPDINTLRAVSSDKSQPEYIRKSVQYFDDFFQGKTVSMSGRSKAEAELCATRTDATLNSLIAVLHSLEKRLPEPLPTEKDVNELDKQFGNSKDFEYKISPVFILAHFANLIKIITYYDKKNADSEVDGFFTRFETKYGATPAGKYWLKDFRMEWNQALEGRKGFDGKWYSGRKQMGLK